MARQQGLETQSIPRTAQSAGKMAHAKFGKVIHAAGRHVGASTRADPATTWLPSIRPCGSRSAGGFGLISRPD